MSNPSSHPPWPL